MTKRTLVVGVVAGAAAGLAMAGVEMVYGWASSAHTAWDPPMGIWAYIGGLDHFGRPVHHIGPIVPFNDVKRFSEFLAEDFISQFPGVTRNRAEFLDYIAKPRPFKDLAMHDVNIRILTSDVALIHGRATYTILADGREQEALYTDTYQKRDGTWVCVA